MKSMARNRFLELYRYIHLANNPHVIASDKMFKIRSLLDMLNSKFQKWDIMHKNLSIDGSMVKYFGHHEAKQSIRGKPVRVGFKV